MTDDEREGLALTDDEIDRLVAERVCGWERCPPEETDIGCWFKDGAVVEHDDDWHPSTDLNDAVRAAREAGLPWSVGSYDKTCGAATLDVSVCIARHLYDQDDNPARALCLAALRAKGVEV